MAASSIFPGTITGVTVETATSGALSGDGSSGNKLAVGVDGVTIDVNGSNQLEVKGNGPFDQSLNTTDTPSFEGLSLTGGTPVIGGDSSRSVFNLSMTGTASYTQQSHDFRPLQLEAVVTASPTDDVYNLLETIVEQDDATTALHNLTGLLVNAQSGLADAESLYALSGAVYNYGNVTGGGMIGVLGTVYHNHDTGKTVSGSAGIEGYVTVAGNGDVAYVSGISVYPATNEGTGTVADSIGVDILGPTNSGGGAVTKNTGLRIAQMTLAGADSYTIDASASTAPSLFGGTIQAIGYKSSDGSTGDTTTVTTASLVGKTMTFKNGLLVSFA